VCPLGLASILLTRVMEYNVLLECFREGPKMSWRENVIQKGGQRVTSEVILSPLFAGEESVQV
jgi:hypothetical protein